MEDLKDLDYCSHRKFFNFYTVLPVLLAILCFVGFLIGGIVDAWVHQVVDDFFQPRYGIMGLPNVFLCLLIWMLIGSVCSALVYLFTKLAVSFMILVVMNLEKISNMEGYLKRKEQELSESGGEDAEGPAEEQPPRRI